MNNLKLSEHKSSSYAPRTYHNASQGVTLAIAVDFSTAGERLTHKAAGDRILQVHYETDWLETARMLYSKLKAEDCHTINIAGNGIYTLQKRGISQDAINLYVYKVIKIVNEHWKIDKVVSGGQTGTDMAGLISAFALGIPAEGTWPKGYKMRWEDGKDVDMDRSFIEEYIKVSADILIQGEDK